MLSYAAVQVAFNAAQSAMLSAYGQITADISGFLGLAGFNQAVGIVLGAISARIALNSVTKLGMLSK